MVASLQSVPPAPVDVTLTSSDSSVFIISKVATAAGSASVSYDDVATNSFGTFYLQGLSQGSATLTISAPGYASATRTVNITPSGFIIFQNDFITTSFSTNSNLNIRSYRLNAGLVLAQLQAVRGGLTVNVPISSSDTNVGVVTTSPVVFSGNQSQINTAFDPVSAGTSVLTLTQPTGFDIPTTFQSSTATVTAPNINVSNVIVGKDLQTGYFISLQAAPPSPVDVTVTVSAPTVAVISDSVTTVGVNSITFSGVTGTSVGTVTVQGLAVGVTAIVATAPGYNDGNSTATVDPSGFIFQSPGNFTTTVAAANTNMNVRPYRLNPTTLNVVQIQTVRAGLSVDVEVTSSAPAVGVITTSPLTFIGNDNFETTQFDPLTAGSTQIEVVAPTGFSTPSNFQTITATVNP